MHRRPFVSPTTPGPAFDLTPLEHPLWWLALAALIINDRALKGAGVVPGWLTGKLSDFAFLIVAPVLLACVLPTALRGRRVFACASVAVVFAATDLSPAVSDALVGAAAHVGLRWRLWPDPTDLVALGLVPLAAWLLRARRQPADGTEHPFRRIRRFAAVSLGSFACLATSAPPSYPHAAFFVNRTPGPLTLSMTWLLRKVPCDGAPALAASLTAGDLGSTHVVRLERGQVAALDAPPVDDAQAAGQCSNAEKSWGGDSECVGVVLEANGTAVLAVARRHWTEYEDGAFFSCSRPARPVSRCEPTLDARQNPGDDAVWFTSESGTLVAGSGEMVTQVTVSRSAIDAGGVAPQSCRATLDRQRAVAQAGAACTSDPDCLVAPGLPLDGEPCTLYVGAVAAAGELQAIDTTWRSSCSVNDQRGCPYYVQPPACRAGRCGPTCPGVSLPSCPGPCPSDLEAGQTCGFAYTCRNSAGRFCRCDGWDSGRPARVVCELPARVADGCPLVCLEPPGPPRPLDGGTDARLDADASVDGAR